MLVRWCLAVLLALAAFASAAADKRVLVLRDDGAVVRQTASALAAEFSRLGIGESAVAQFDLAEADRAAALAGRLRQENALVAVVALGPKAVRPALQLAAGKAVVVALVSRATVEDGAYPADHVVAIILDQPVERLLNFAQLALPGARQVGVLAGPATQRSLRQLERNASERHLALVTEAIGNPDELVTAAERLTPRIRLLLAIPDPLVHSRNTILPLLLATYRAGVPVLAYSESYLQAGAALALYSTPVQIAQQVGEVALQILDGKHPAGILAPKYYTVGINATVVRSLGLSLPPPAEIEERLQLLEKSGAP